MREIVGQPNVLVKPKENMTHNDWEMIEQTELPYFLTLVLGEPQGVDPTLVDIPEPEPDSDGEVDEYPDRPNMVDLNLPAVQMTMAFAPKLSQAMLEGLGKSFLAITTLRNDIVETLKPDHELKDLLAAFEDTNLSKAAYAINDERASTEAINSVAFDRLEWEAISNDRKVKLNFACMMRAIEEHCKEKGKGLFRIIKAQPIHVELEKHVVIWRRYNYNKGYDCGKGAATTKGAALLNYMRWLIALFYFEKKAAGGLPASFFAEFQD